MDVDPYIYFVSCIDTPETGNLTNGVITELIAGDIRA